jgi:hypothetical protein
MMIAVEVVLDDLHGLLLFEASLLGNLVFALVGIVFEVSDIGDVADISDGVAEVLEIAIEDVEGDGGTCVSEVSVAIDGGAADVHAYAVGDDGAEELLLSVEGIVD